VFALLTDFGHDGLYVGQMHATLVARRPAEAIIDLCHGIPAQDIRCAAYLLPAYSQCLPAGSIVICVVDPGVGGKRPHAVCQADGRWYLGPDNGLFDVLQQHARQFVKWHFTWPAATSASFHGRDVYAPAACLVAEAGNAGVLHGLEQPGGKPAYAPDLTRVILFDHFGNALTGQRFKSLPGSARVSVNGHPLSRATTFCDVATGSALYYENANGLLELAVNRGSAQDGLGLRLGDRVEIVTRDG
jgi:S-adenosylmethionine hydrolase